MKNIAGGLFVSKTTYHFLRTIFSHLVPVCAAISFFRSPIVSSGLNAGQKNNHGSRFMHALTFYNYWRILALHSYLLPETVVASDLNHAETCNIVVTGLNPKRGVVHVEVSVICYVLRVTSCAALHPSDLSDGGARREVAAAFGLLFGYGEPHTGQDISS